MLVQYLPLWFYSLHRCNDKTSSTRIRRRTCHSQIETYDESYCQDPIVRVDFNFSEPVEEISRKSRSMKNQLMEKIYQGNLVKKQIYSKPLIIATKSNSWRASLQQIIQNWIKTVLGLLKSGKLRSRRTIDQGNLTKLLGEWYDKFDLITKKFFSTEPRNP